MCFPGHIRPVMEQGNGANRKAPEKTITRSGSPYNREYRKTIWNFIITIPISSDLWRSRFRKDQEYRQVVVGGIYPFGAVGFIYDFKDIDYTRTAYNLIEKHGYPHKFYYVSFDRPARSYRFNPLKVVKDRTELLQLMEDILLALLPKKEQQNEWVAGGLGILRGVASGLGRVSLNTVRCLISWRSS